MTYNILQEFEQAGALMKGHFVLSSGLHSETFLQKNLVMMYPQRAERACKALVEKIEAQFGKIDVVISPAVGGIIPGYETARHLGCRAIFTERVQGTFELRRGFYVEPHEKAIIVEDIVTTGLSMRECVAALSHLNIQLVGGACLIDRSSGQAETGLSLVSLAQMDIPTYHPDNLPEHLQNIPAVKPGSRDLSKAK